MPLCYEETFTALHTECDVWNHMLPSAILRRAQAISTAQCVAMGINEETYAKTQSIFLLSRLSLEIKKAPELMQEITIKTVAHGVKRAVFHRTTKFCNENGQVLAEVDTRWVLVSLETRRILRTYSQEFADFCMQPRNENWHEMKMETAENLEIVFKGRASYSMCDRNGHINNANYADVVCDNLPIEKLKQGLPKKMLLLYRAEIPMGENFDLLFGKTSNGKYFFEAQVAGKKNFECLVTF